MFVKSKHSDYVWNKLENWQMTSHCEISGVGPMGLSVSSMVQTEVPFEELEPGHRVGIMGYGWWILGEPLRLAPHQLHTIYTAHYSYSGPDRVDITVKGQDPNWKEFAPTWAMVMGIKNGTMTQQQYLDLYEPGLGRKSIIGEVSGPTWHRLMQMRTVTFVCFDPEGEFCHRNILTNYIIRVMDGAVVYGGWRV